MTESSTERKMIRRPTLGGKLSIIVAVIWALSTASAMYAPYKEHLLILSSASCFVSVVLSMPIAYFSGALWGSFPSTKQWIFYLFLMIPNCFILGYALAGLWNIFRPSSLRRLCD